MANPTTYFGWVMPNSADLVTDLPADFAVFGQGVDTSMQSLLGGTTGQVLSKTSGTNMAFTWIANDQGDLTAITAGTGISVTSPTGPIPTVAIDATVATLTGSQTLTNKTLTSPIISSISNTGTLTLPTSTDTLVGKATTDTLTNKTLTSPALTTPTISTATTNGDLLYGTGSGALARLGIGTTGQNLVVASGIPSWATPSSGALTKIVTGSFSAVANTSTTFDGCFTSTYKNYQVVFSNMKSSAATDLLLQLRVGAVTTATNYYGSFSNVNYNASISSTGSNNATSAKILPFNSVADPSSLNMIFSGVGNSSSKGLFYGNGYTFTQSAALWVGYQQETAAVYTGFILSVASGTVTGTVTVYGLAD